LCARLDPYVAAFEGISGKLSVAKNARNWVLCKELKAELDRFPKTVEEFELQELLKVSLD
jgi:hypothetical protein